MEFATRKGHKMNYFMKRMVAVMMMMMTTTTTTRIVG
jgi:hypothetical protein